MATPTIPNGEEYFFPIIYEGNGKGQRVGKFVPFTDNGTIAHSCVFDQSTTDKEYLTRTAGASPTSERLFTISFWVKFCKLGTKQTLLGLAQVSGSTQRPVINYEDTGKLTFVTSGGTKINRTTDRTFEDTSKWYHFLAKVNVDEGTPADRVKIYVDGEEQSLTGQTLTNSDPFDLASQTQNIGRLSGTSQLFTGYLAEINYVDGTALGPDTFGVTDTSTGRWIPKTLSGITYGTNGFRLAFGTSSAMGDDTANSNDFTPNNIDATNQTTDSPTQNFATLQGTGGTLSEGNLKLATGTSDFSHHNATLKPKSGKYYAEFTCNSMGRSEVGVVSTLNVPYSSNTTRLPTTSDGSVAGYMYYGFNGSLYYTSANASAATYATYTTNDIISIALDLDNHTVEFFKTDYDSGTSSYGSRTSQGTIGLPNGNYTFALGDGATGFSGGWTANFGQTSFQDTPPTGFVALQQDNLPETSKGVADLVWVKARDDGTLFHVLYNSSRGARTFLYPNGTQAEQGENGSANTTLVDGVQKFLKGGFSVEDQTNVNQSGNSFVSWNWSCNSGTTESISAGGGIDVASTVQKNTTAGFSIVEFTTPSSTQDFTTGHGLSVAPRVFFFKRLDSTSGWAFYHQDNFDANGTEHTLFLNLNNASYAPNPGTAFYPSATTATTFSLRAGASIATSANCVAYCFNEVEGFSKFGKYTGNGDPDGPFVYTGFKPAWIMIKQTNSTGGWIMTDTKRSPFNPVDKLLSANLTNTESTFTSLDILSNGFKQRNTDTGFNGSSSTYIYMAFAEHPFVGDGTNPVTAR